MRNFLFYAISIVTLTLSSVVYGQVSPCLVSSGIATGNCPVTGDPYIESPCIAGIQKQIARSVSAENLVGWITPGTCWGWIGTNGTTYDENAIPAPNVSVNCNPPYDRCYGNYCPDKYCTLIKTFVDLKASMILRAASTWSNHWELKPGTAYYQGMKQIVIDINAAYDCAGLQRPIIQGGIFENIDPSVSAVPIPADIINAFKNTVGFPTSYYLDALGLPKALNFDKEQIRFLSATNLLNCPDISRIEARMWFYYLAKMYIDLGYKSIHMGQLNLWSRQDPALTYTTALLGMIRSYAQSKNTFVLLTEENNRALKFPGTSNFMFDYDSRAIRAREIGFFLGTPVCGDFGCVGPANNYLVNTPCANELYPAIIDECVLSTGGNSSGYSPVSGCLLPYQPFNTYFDFGPGDYPPVGVASPGCQEAWGTWGWDDSKWFASKISLNCRAFWMQDAICRVRTYFNGFGFMAAPGLLPVNMPTNAGKYLQNLNPTADAKYLLPDEPSVKNTIVTSWTANANPGINSYITCGPAIGTCDFNGLLKRVRKTHFYVYQPDCTSSYTWHIKNPDNTWQTMGYGKERALTVTVPGIYTIYLRIDNLGLPGGVKQISVEQYLEPYCCYPVEVQLAKQGKTDTIISDEIAYRNLEENVDDLPINPESENSQSNVQKELFHSNNNDVIAFPSPTSTIFTVKASSTAYNSCSLTIKDITGRTITESDAAVNLNSGWSVTCKDWANGVYFIEVHALSGAHTVLKIVKF